MSHLSSIRTTVNTNSTANLNLSFAGCGFLGIYHVGVASCCKTYAPHLFQDKIAGASAGALVASALICDCCLGECTTFTLRLALQARSHALGPLHPSFTLVKSLRDAMWDFLPSNAHEIANGRLFISLTRVSDRKNVLVSHFPSKQDLIDALTCSSFVPLYSGVFPPKFRGVHYVDGAFSDNIPVLDDHTITVSPFAGESDICPNDNSYNSHHIYLGGTSIQMSAFNFYRMSVAFFPPSPEILSNMCRQGFDDALRYLQRNNLISCTEHLSIQSALIGSSPLDFDEFEELSHETMSSVATDQTVESQTACDLADLPGEPDDDDDEDSLCDNCIHQQHAAFTDTLPPPVTSALQAACDSVNKGLLSKVYKLRVYKVLSVLAGTWILPMDIAIQLTKNLHRWAPYLPRTMRWFIRELYAILKSMTTVHHAKALIGDIESGCALLNQFGISCQWAVNLIGASDYPSRGLGLTRRISLSMGFSMDYHHQSAYHGPLYYVSQARQRMLSGDDHQDGQLSDATNLESQPAVTTEMELQNSDLESSIASYDTFDDCLHITNQIDSLLSYYYLSEEDHKTIRVVEIFPLHHSQGPQPTFTPSYSEPSRQHRVQSAACVTPVLHHTTEEQQHSEDTMSDMEQTLPDTF